MNDSTFPSFWNVQCPTQYVIWKIEILQSENGNEWIDSFYFQRSNDNDNWYILAYSTGQMSSIGIPPSVLAYSINK